VEDFTLSTPSSSTTNTPTASVLPGGTATYTLNIGPSVGTVFPAPVTLSLSGLPPGATGTLSLTTLPAGSALSSVTLTIQLPQQSASAAPLLRWLTPSLALLLLPFSRSLRRRTKGLGQIGLMVLLLFLGAGAAAGVMGCGARNTGFFGQPSVSYTVVITATSGTLSHSTSVILNIQ
jgi:hypothetical protein